MAEMINDKNINFKYTTTVVNKARVVLFCLFFCWFVFLLLMT